MKALLGFALLLAFNYAGIWLHETLHLPLPGNVLGLILFLAALWTKLVRLEWVEQSAQFLLKHMILFFIPYVVGIIAFLPVLKANWFSIFVGIVGSTFMVLYVTGFIAHKMQLAARTEAPEKGATL